MKIRVRVNTTKKSAVVVGIQGPPGVSGTLNGMEDVDMTAIEDGSVLVYNSATGKWTAQRLLDKQIINGADDY